MKYKPLSTTLCLIIIAFVGAFVLLNTQQAKLVSAKNYQTVNQTGTSHAEGQSTLTYSPPTARESFRNSQIDKVKGRHTDIEIVTITHSGIVPREIRRQKGEFALVVINLIGAPDKSLQLLSKDERNSEQRENILSGIKLKNHKGVRSVKLASGSYDFQVAGSPETDKQRWNCTIIID